MKITIDKKESSKLTMGSNPTPASGKEQAALANISAFMSKINLGSDFSKRRHTVSDNRLKFTDQGEKKKSNFEGMLDMLTDDTPELQVITSQ